MAPMAKKVSFKGLFIIISSTLIILKMIFYITSTSLTSKLMMHDHDDHHFDLKQRLEQPSDIFNSHIEQTPRNGSNGGDGSVPEVHEDEGSQLSDGGSTPSKVEALNVKEVYHDKDMFLENYKEMNKTMKIYIYPHTKTDPFANVFFPNNDGLPGGNYASESYFKIALSLSHFVTQDPSEADLFFLPFSIACMRHDKRIGVDGIKDFIKDYLFSISRKYPFWNRTGGADHFYACEPPMLRISCLLFPSKV
ncbi:probable glycosyltransferase At3g07620 [Helianthus annuus]|nr:probable glycosyltransferase At3g07620 [Helianthus annuus]